MSPIPLATLSWSETMAKEVRPMLRLGGPVVAAELAWMMMGLVDTLMVGRVSAVVMGAVGLGHALFFAVVVMGMGTLFSLDYYVSRAHGAGDHTASLRHLIQGCWLAVFMSPPLMLLLATTPAFLLWFGVTSDVVVETDAYLTGVVWSLPFMLLFTALRRYLQAVELVRPIMVVIIAANLVNLVSDWAMIFGHLGLPAMGASGAGWATAISRLFLASGLVFIIHRQRRIEAITLPDGAWRPNLIEMATLVRLGLPAAGHLLLEVGMFSGATILVGLMDPLSLAAHQISMQIVSFTFMIPMGLSSAGAVRVGHGLGRGDVRGGVAAGWVTLAMGVGAMAVSSVLIALFRGPLTRAFTSDTEVLMIGGSLLLFAAAFQVFDAIQVVSAGILRGLGETKASMVANLIGHWCVGLPVGAYLAFKRGWGVQGLWLGLCIGLVIVGIYLLTVWIRRTRRLLE